MVVTYAGDINGQRIRHYFFKLGPASCLSFFEWPGVELLPRKDADGNVYNNEYHWLFEVRDGKIQAAREYMCTAHIAEVLGPLMASAA